jgi:UDP-N-acetylmuramate dehydrogenase
MADIMDKAPFEFAYENYLLAPATYYKVGGPAALALIPRNLDEAEEAYRWMLRQPERKLVLGCGSNVLISDDGFPGIVYFTTSLKQLEPLGDDRYRLEAGVELGDLVQGVMVANNYDGVGAVTGIPASVGGAVYMNAGTVNGSTSDFLESIELLTPESAKLMQADSSLFGYRTQHFCGPDDVIVRVTFHFRKSDLNQREVYEHYIRRRQEKQPKGDCCGSVFRNPPGEHAGRLIEACGLKGTRRGGAVISPMHANFIINEGGATFEDIIWLMNLCRQCVRDKFGMELHEEVKIIR